MIGDAGHDFRAPARFTIQRRLGEGGFGVVYEAYDRQRDAVIALKALRRTDAGALYRFKREFRTLADLAHPNLVTLYELISEWEQWLLAMELIRGVDFCSYVREGHGASQDLAPTMMSALTLPDPIIGMSGVVNTAVVPDATQPGVPARPIHAERLRASMRQLAEGVDFLHRQGILHRDIKPSNVLVTPEGRVVLLDFGLATGFAPEERSDSVHLVGTPEYMAPEQAAGQELSEASDWYSVGVVLYRALTGRLPFVGPLLAILREKLERDPVLPSQLVPSLPGELDELESLCRDLLHRDPVSRPCAREILARLGAEQRLPAAVASAPLRAREALTFIGRRQHLVELGEALDMTRSGKTITLHVRGGSGMGKTALVRHFLRTVRETERDVVVLAGRCYEREAVPYKALDSLVDALTDHLKTLSQAHAEALLPRGVAALARVFPVMERVEAVTASMRRMSVRDMHELRRRASAAFREMLGRLAERTTLILFIDDVQWGDVDSATLLSELLSPPDQPALLLIICYRGEEADTSPMLRALVPRVFSSGAGVDVRVLDVGELAPDEAGELVQTIVGGDQVSPERAGIIARESRGSPFFIDQLVRHGGAGGQETSLDAVLRNRASQLTNASRTLLEVTAVAGRPLELAVANQAADLESGDYDVVASLVATHFIRTRVTGDRREIEPYHDRIRETIVAALSPQTLKRHHERLALALETSGRADPEALAVHFQAAGDTARAARYALGAADRAAGALAFERAARLYRLALDLRAAPDPERRHVWVKLGDALANAGRVIEAASAYLTAAAGADPAAHSELQRQAAEQLLMGGHLDEGFRLLRSVLRGAGLPLPATPRRALFWILLRRPYMLWRGSGFRERSEGDIPAGALWRIDLCHSAVRSLGFTETVYAVELQMRHLLLALKVGEPYRVARALGFEAIADARHRRGRARAERFLKVARELAGRTEGPHKADADANIHVTTGMLAFLAGHWGPASHELQQAEQIFRDQSALPYKIVVCQIYTLNALLYAGEIAHCFRCIPECLRESLDRGNVFAEANLRLLNAQRLCFGDDDPGRALGEAREAMARWSPRGFHQVHASQLFHQADFALYQEHAAGAWQRIDETWSALSRSFLLGLETIFIPAHGVRGRAALMMAGEAVPARRSFLASAERAARLIERQKTHWGDPLAALIRAGVAVTRGDREGALACLRAAERGFESAHMALHAAVARSRRGALLQGDEGRALVLDAHQWMAGQGLRNPGRMIAMIAPGSWE